MDASVRVVVANRPRLLRELVLSTLSGQAGIEVVGEAENEQDVPSLVAATKPDFLLIALEESRRRPPLCDLLLREYPALRIIAVAPNTNVGIFYWASFEIHSRTMEASEEALLEAVRSSAASGNEEAALQQAAMQQRQRVLEALRRAPISGRLVVHIGQGRKGFAGSADDLELRAGDTLEIPKQPGFVTIVGQVYNSNAITYAPGKNAGWYLSHAGGATGLANKKAIFIVRANGSVTSGSSGPWSGGVLSSPIGPGDTSVVPEKTVLGGNTWKNVVAIAQIAQAAALAAAVAIP